MSLNADVKNIAQGYAQHLCDTNTFSHSGNTYQSSWLGENLFAVGGSNPIDLNTRNGTQTNEDQRTASRDTFRSRLHTDQYVVQRDLLVQLHFAWILIGHGSFHSSGLECEHDARSGLLLYHRSIDVFRRGELLSWRQRGRRIRQQCSHTDMLTSSDRQTFTPKDPPFIFCSFASRGMK